MKKTLLITAIAAFAGAGAAFAGNACCAKGAPCCKPGAACCADSSAKTATDASQESQALVQAYEQLSNAVFDGNMTEVKETAGKVAQIANKQQLEAVATQAKAVAQAADVSAARKAFVGLSRETIAAVDDQPGYYVMSCPMVQNGQWLQTSKELHNPYMGESMPRCGFIKRETGKTDQDI